jgi:hypothetical protein
MAQGLHQINEGLVGSQRPHSIVNRLEPIEHQAKTQQNDADFV